MQHHAHQAMAAVLTRDVPVCPLQQPEVAELQQVLQPVADHMMQASALAENRRSQAFNQLKVVAEALHGLSWLAYTGPNCGKKQLLLAVGSGMQPPTVATATAAGTAKPVMASCVWPSCSKRVCCWHACNSGLMKQHGGVKLR